MKTKIKEIVYAQDVYAQRDGRFHVRTNKELKKLLQGYCKEHGLDLSKILNDTLIWVACKKKIIDSPFKPIEPQKLEDWWDSNDDPKPRIYKIA